MVNIDGVFSVRLVIADFYLEKPTFGLDPCYSESRAKEIKRVPVIRIFGSNGTGQKTCMHVHGVFPYFYIPYEKRDFESANKAIYQIATNVDKALNISLGQGSSAAQHVFKIQLVKGIPFYGYHRSEHQFLKIYMFNPRFVRRAATLLQNGAILGKNFHPHESHVPYILQFMIDYNLYGMSFLHVPMEVVKFRRVNDEQEIPYPHTQQAQILSSSIAKKQSCCALEVDIGSNFILNRFQLLTKNDTVHSNPGIESIWQDERMRRQKLAISLADDSEKQNAIPVLEVPPTQERPHVQPADSETFYRTALVSKLQSLDASMSGTPSDQTLSCTQQQMDLTNVTLNATSMSNKEQRRTFNLKKLLVNAVYPEECTQSDKLVNASFIENHLSKGGSSDPFYMTATDALQLAQTPEEANATLVEDESAYMDDTVVDEELVLSLTQQHVPLNASLREEDMKLLDLLQQLEEGGLEDNPIDLDSSLAPLSQPHKNFELAPELLDKEAANAAANQSDAGSESESESDNEGGGGHALDFSIAMDDIDELLLKLTQSQPKEPDPRPCASQMPQMDGTDDLLRTPTKASRGSKRSANSNAKVTKSPPRTPTTPATRGVTACVSPQRSPRTPKSSAASKYAPLPLKIVNKSEKKINPGPATTPTKSTRLSLNIEGSNVKTSLVSLRKKLALTELRRKSISSANEINRSVESTPTVTAESTKTCRRSLRKTADLDKTHITCALTPRRKSERLLKVYSVETDEQGAEASAQPAKQVTEEPSAPTSSDEHYRREEGQEKKNRPKEGKEKKNRTRISARLRTATSNLGEITKDDPQGKDTASVDTVDTDLRSVEKQLLNLKECLERSMQGSADTEIATPKPAARDAKTTGEDDEEEEAVLASDQEDERSLVKLRKTPNLRRLRRSFHAAESVRKRKRLTAAMPAAEGVCNSSKFHIVEEAELHKDEPRTPTSNGIHGIKESTKDRDPFVDDAEGFSDDDPQVHSFYEKSFGLDSPSVFSDMSSPGLGVNGRVSKTPRGLSRMTSVGTPTTTAMSSQTHLPIPQAAPAAGTATKPGCAVITPMDLPPTYEEALTGCRKFGIHEFKFQNPYYSNPDDITKQKEVGFTVLHVPGNKLNDLPEFQSILGPDHKGLCSWRRRKLVEVGGPLMLNKHRTTQQVREYFARKRRVVIVPHLRPPTKHEAKVWLKARELLRNNNDEATRKGVNVGEDSPIKIRRQKVTMMLNDHGDGAGDGDGDGLGEKEDMDYSTCSLTLTPLTPGSPLRTSADATEGGVQCGTPLTTLSSASQKESKSCSRQKRRSRRSKVSLIAKLDAVVQKVEQQPEAAVQTSDELRTSQGSETSVETSVSSQSVLRVLESSAFVRGLQSGARAPLDASFGLTNATLNNTFGFKVNLENLQEAKADIECNYLTTVTLEVFVPTRGDLYPDPKLDEIRCIFYAIDNSVPPGSTEQPTKVCGYIIVNDASDLVREGKKHGIDADIEVKVVATEVLALEELLALCALWDPDIYAGYEIEMSSWGYVIDRAKHLCLNIAPLLSRVPTQKVREFVDEDREQFTDLDVEMKLCGRILLDVWRLMRSEIALTSYTFENVMYHILHKRCPWHNYRALTNWFESPCSRWIVLEYYLERVRGTLALLDQLDLIGRTSEMAKLIGIQFYEVLSRGSQFRVESMMLRIAKPRNLVPVSPSVQQRAHMRAPEYLALILEPQSRFYADPLIVLDFQSLYPSMIIGYNYCFSTCLGRVEHLGQSTPFEFGASQLRVSPAMLRKLLDRDLVTISPCGVVFIKASVREGILPRMLAEILDTRQMVKQSMKLHKSNSALQRILHSRQLGLKLMANVTYGYTAANFSGRMPSVEVGDSVVAKGRETLERAIKMVETNDKWNVKVVYGDTDSLFVLVPGRNRAEAFKIGEEIAEAVTKINPHPVKLKLEKVYQPCILQTKKRYVGYMYETPDQAEPVYEAKGIETVRRDGCPAVAKMLEKVLRILFETADVSQVKQYVCRQFTKLLSGRANLQDLIFAKEFRGLNGYKPTACVPALELTKKWIQVDPRRIPRRGERVPFVITNGPPGVPLIRLVRHPHEVLANEGYKINAIYYITKAIIPPLNRCLLLIGADASEWFTNLPRKILMTPALSTAGELVAQHGPSAHQGWAKRRRTTATTKSTISQYFSTTNCIVDCGRQTKEGICGECGRNRMKTFVTLHGKIARIERAYHLTEQMCQACCGRVGDLACGSLDCPVLYVLEVKRRDLQQIAHFRTLLERHQ